MQRQDLSKVIGTELTVRHVYNTDGVSVIGLFRQNKLIAFVHEVDFFDANGMRFEIDCCPDEDDF